MPPKKMKQRVMMKQQPSANALLKAQQQQAQAAAQRQAMMPPPAFVLNLGPLPAGAEPGSEPMQASDIGDRDFSKWTVIYPAYLDGTKTRAEGRRVNADLAVQRPEAPELAEACLRLGFTDVCLESYKQYSRSWGEAGRIRVLMTDEDKLPVHGDIPTKKLLMRRICEKIPELKSRTEPAKQQAAAKEKEIAQAKVPSTKVGKSKSKKKKGGRRR
jgi:signal recognition particle subunit SRP19